MTKVLIDSNILVYAADNSDEHKHKISTELLEKAMNKGDAVVSIQNLVEFARVATEKIERPIDLEKTRQIIMELSDSMEVIAYDQKTIAEALHFSARYKLHFFDALLVATMEENFIKEIITENDKDFKGITWLKVDNPFRRKR